MTDRLAEAAGARRDAAVMPADRPSQRRCADIDDAPTGVVLGTARAALRSTVVERADGDDVVSLTPGVVGVASVVDTGYEMYDAFGPYTEIVSRDAFDGTLKGDPLVEFTLNHNRGGGLPMAHTRNGTLKLTMTDEGLEYDATVDATRSDVQNMLKALERGDLAESSFKFRINAGRWNEAMDTYTILDVDLNRGDVSAVNFGANPHATSKLRMVATDPGAAEALAAMKPRVLVPRSYTEPRTINGL